MATSSSQPLDIRLPYVPESPGGPVRPYLWLDLVGPNGNKITTRGLIDSGADITSLPLPYVALLGVPQKELTKENARQVAGPMTVWNSKRPLVTASLLGVGLQFPLQPSFIDGALSVLWGRLDFMIAWDVFFQEREKHFTIRWRGS